LYQGWQVLARRWKKNVFSIVKTGLSKILFVGKNGFLLAKIDLCQNCHRSKLEPLGFYRFFLTPVVCNVEKLVIH